MSKSDSKITNRCQYKHVHKNIIQSLKESQANTNPAMSTPTSQLGNKQTVAPAEI